MKEAAPKWVEIPLLVVGPTACISLSDSLYHDLHSWFFVHTPMGPFLLVYASPALAAALCSLWVVLALKQGRDTLWSVAVGYALALFVLFNFRGPLHWQGLFDLQDRPSWVAWSWAPASAALGAAASLALRRKRVPDPVPFLVTSVAVALAYGWIQALARDDVYSAYPCTRHIALSLLVVAAALGSAVVSRWYPELWEA